MAEYNKIADIDISITTRTFVEFRENATLLFDQIKTNVAFRGEVWLLEVETLSSFKFKIYGPGLTRPIDLFRIPYAEAKMVKKFHVPCVRMWYSDRQTAKIVDMEIVSKCDDISINIYDSCLRALLSGVNNSYKWFSCNKIPADVLLKYAQRGITIVLNKKERDALVKYIRISPRWSDLVDVESDIFGIVNSKHKFFYPAAFNLGIRMDLRNYMFDEDDTFYSKRHAVEYPSHETIYEGNLAVKNNNSTIPPKLENITKYINYCKEGVWEEEDE
jgi:hypothetical protein